MTRAAITIAAILFALPATAQTFCAAREKVLADLEAKYGEAVTGRGLTSTGRMFEVVASSDGETFTALLTDPNGMTCLLAAGIAWTEIKADSPGEDG